MMHDPKPTDAKNSGGAAQKPVSKGSPLWSKLFTVVVLVGAALFSIALLPRGYSQDVSLVGQGDRVVVLFQEEFSVDGQRNMDTMNALRSEYDDRVQFVVADRKLEQGKKFAEKYEINSTAFIFFTPTGKKIVTLYGEQSRELLRENINKAFNL